MGAGESSLPDPLLITRTPLYCQNPAALLAGHTLLCSSSGGRLITRTSGAFRCCLASLGQTEAELAREGKRGRSGGVSQMLPGGTSSGPRLTLIPSHSLASLAGTEDGIRCPHHLLPFLCHLCSNQGRGWVNWLWVQRRPSGGPRVPTRQYHPPPAAHPALRLAFRSSITHAAFGTHQTTSKWPPSLPGCGAGTAPPHSPWPPRLSQPLPHSRTP